MSMLYRNRKEAADACEYEASHAKHFSEVAIEAAANGDCGKAWAMADNSRIAARCAMQAHEDLWEMAHGRLTEAEYEVFIQAEIAQSDATKAERAAAAAVEKRNRRAEA